MKTLVASAATAIVLAAPTGASNTSPCDTLMPKGGGTVIHGTYVPLERGEFLMLCRR